MESVMLLPCAAAGAPTVRSARARAMARAVARHERARLGRPRVVIALLHAPSLPRERVFAREHADEIRDAPENPLKEARCQGASGEGENEVAVPCMSHGRMTRCQPTDGRPSLCKSSEAGGSCPRTPFMSPTLLRWKMLCARRGDHCRRRADIAS